MIFTKRIMEISANIYINAPVILILLLVIVMVSILICSCMRVPALVKEVIGVILIIVWMIILIDLTIIIRDKTPLPQILLTPFWCIKEAWKCRDAEDWYLIIGNIAIFMPLGIILPYFFKFRNKIAGAMGIGFVVSLFIEISQYIFHRGFFEIDDLINNTLGCILGYTFIVIYETVLNESKWRRVDRMASLGVWVFMIIFTVVALFQNQPVFGWI